MDLQKRVTVDMALKGFVLVAFTILLMIIVIRDMGAPDWVISVITMVFVFFFRSNPKGADIDRPDENKRSKVLANSQGPKDTGGKDN
jgi:hypothetical protein